jgi:hypothetical protein
MYGRRTPKRAPAIRFSAVRRSGAVPTPPPAVDYFTLVNGGWLMLGNGPDDSVLPGFPGCGDCVAVEWANTRRMISTVLGPTASPPVQPLYPTWPMTLQVYQTQNAGFDPAGDPSVNGPGSPADGGMDIQSLLEFLVANPGFGDGGVLVGFAAVDFTNAEEVQAAVDAGGVLWTGINVQDAQMTEFNNGQAWDPVAGSPLDGGHAIATGGYGAVPAGSPSQEGGGYEFITWGEETSFTPAFLAQNVEEMWFPVWAEQLGTAEFQAGVDLAAFEAEFTAITGKPFPAPAPVPAPPPPPGPTPPPVPVPPVPPAPTPPPVPGPDADDTALWDAAGEWAHDRHEGEARRVARALRTWAQAKGFTS